MSLTAAAEARPAGSGFAALGFIAMMVGNFMALLDIQIVASSIGAIQAGVGATRDEISWVQTAYLIAEVIGIPLSGFLARAMGTRMLFVMSSALFTLSSLLCSFAWDISSLVFFRVLQGFTGAAMVPTTMATLFLVIPPKSQPMAMAMVGMISTLAPSVGPTFGGYIAEAFDWRALFWINVVPGLFVTLGVWFTLPEIDKPDLGLLKRIDMTGLIGMALFLGSAEYVLEEGPGAEWFSSSEIWFWSAVTLIGAVLFFWRSAVSKDPIVDLRPFKTPTFAAASVLAFVLGVGLYASAFLLPVFLGSVRGYNPLQIGHTMFLQGAVMFIGGPILGTYIRGVKDTRWLGLTGFFLLAYSCFIQAHMTAEWGLSELWFPQACRGLGLLMIFSSVMQPAMQSLPPHLVHAGSGLFSTVRNIGGAFGIAALTTVQFHAFALHRQELYSAADPTNPHVQQMIQGSQAYLEQAGASDPAKQAVMRYAGLLDREALVMTFNDQFLTLAVVIGLSAFAMLFLRPKLMSGPREQVVAH